MTTYTRLASLALLNLVFLSGCSSEITFSTGSSAKVASASETTLSPKKTPRGATAEETRRLITPESVGEYRIGKSTRESILGKDTSKARKEFADKGLNFEFNQGKELTGVIVSSPDYSLPNGLAVGAKAEEVRNELGAPNGTKLELQPKGIELNALIYDQYAFLLDASNKVSAIRVGKRN